ncbi:hypothetical protein MTP09_00025 [Chryseobacterium suipulveris]|uniref:FeoB-associated Cys-rich membrane protein n=1 Tax=Chryseobacterium suipulveris TaxID=2929800 RepID=A0ABY4BTA7_9FLAO|nr:hypothetical protein [Chryseobacterium suipulveris]UOE41071.1 hypothetical protein MTP09_00025 [Chryseobacterium suipulveris]
MDSLIIQYIIIAVLVLGAFWYFFRWIRNNFTKKKTHGKEPYCDKCSGH